jgi:hypothetical protein
MSNMDFVFDTDQVKIYSAVYIAIVVKAKFKTTEDMNN